MFVENFALSKVTCLEWVDPPTSSYLLNPLMTLSSTAFCLRERLTQL